MTKKDKNFRKLEKNAEKPAVLFSFDGTILNTQPAIIASYQQVFSQHGKRARITPEDELELMQEPVSAMMEKYLPRLNTRKCVQEYEDYQHNHLIDLIQPMTGSQDLLAWLKKKGFRIGILSNRQRSSVVEILEHLHMISFFDVIIGRGVDEKHTTQEDIQLACRLLKTHCAVLVSSSAKDITAGRETGCYTIGLVSNPLSSASIVAEMPDFATGDLSQIRVLLDGEPAWLAYQVFQPEEIAALEEKKQEKARKKENKKRKKEEKKKASKKEKDNKNRKAKKKDSAKKEKTAKKAEA